MYLLLFPDPSKQPCILRCWEWDYVLTLVPRPKQAALYTEVLGMGLCIPKSGTVGWEVFANMKFSLYLQVEIIPQKYYSRNNYYN